MFQLSTWSSIWQNCCRVGKSNLRYFGHRVEFCVVLVGNITCNRFVSNGNGLQTPQAFSGVPSLVGSDRLAVLVACDDRILMFTPPTLLSFMLTCILKEDHTWSPLHKAAGHSQTAKALAFVPESIESIDHDMMQP